MKGESRDKRKPHFRFGYTEPHPIFVLTKIKKFSGTISNLNSFISAAIGFFCSFA